MRETEVDFASELDVDLIEQNQRRKSLSNYKVKRLKCRTTEYTIARQRTVRDKERMERIAGRVLLGSTESVGDLKTGPSM